MCGLNAIFAYADSAPPPSEKELILTRDRMALRGPDAAANWRSDDGRVAFGHRRLSINDLSERANQPMRSTGGDLTVVFNGEIYNYPQKRAELEKTGTVFRTSSDTELLLHLYARYGAEMVHYLRGMFAFIIYDQKRECCFAARDPLGIKPLYFADDGKTFRIASQVKALVAGGGIDLTPSPAGIVGFHIWGSVPDPFTLYAGIRALPAGHRLWIWRGRGVSRPDPYASVAEMIASGSSSSPTPMRRAENLVRESVAESVRAHLLSDVEVGIFLSAGVDSGALLGLMRDAGQTRLTAVTLGFEEFVGTSEDEVPLAARVAEHYGARHVVRRVGEMEFRADLATILEQMDQPSIDGVNTWFVAKALSEIGIKVAISGLGGDELLAGYPGFRQIPRIVLTARALGAIPGGRAFSIRILKALGRVRSQPKLAGLAQYGSGYGGAYLVRRALLLPSELDAVMDPQFIADGLSELRLLDGLEECLRPEPGSTIGRVAAMELANYTRNQLLRDADWAGMAHSVEIRTPILDWEMVQRIAPVMPLLGAGRGKQMLSNAPAVSLPEEIVARRKTGFGIPTKEWMARSGTEKTNPDLSKGITSRIWARRVLDAFDVSTTTTCGECASRRATLAAKAAGSEAV